MIAVPALVLALLVLDWGIAILRPATRSQVWLWGTLTVGAPLWFGALLLVGLFTTTLLLGRTAPALAIDALLVVEFGLYCVSTRVSPMTGDAPALLQQAATNDAWTSEALADAVHKVAFHLGGAAGVGYVAPVFGVLTAIAWLFAARRISSRWSIDLDLVRGYLLATPLTFWFVVGYTENTLLATPFLIAAIGVLLGPWSRRGLALAGALLGVAVAMHASNLLMVASAAAACLLSSRQSLRDRAKSALVLVSVAVIVVTVSLGSCLVAGMRFNAYNMLGGYDHTMWTPFQPNGYLFRFAFQSHAHLIETANIAVHAAPMLVVALPILLLRQRRSVARWLQDATGDRQLSLLALMSTAYLVFVSVWGFDYGLVGDLDLMLVLDVPLCIYVLIVVQRLVLGRTSVLAGLIVASAVLQLAFYSYKVSLVWWPPPA